MIITYYIYFFIRCCTVSYFCMNVSLDRIKISAVYVLELESKLSTEPKASRGPCADADFKLMEAFNIIYKNP